MKRALIQGTRICEVADVSFPVAPDLQWVDVADDTTTKDTYENGAVIKYAPPVLSIAEQALQEITRLESFISERRKREALLDNAEAIAFIQGVEDDIAIERAKL
jgi:hypothetical protein